MSRLSTPVFLAAVLWVTVCAPSVWGARVHTHVSRDSLTVGDRIELVISVVGAEDGEIQPPPAEQGFGPFVVKDWSRETREVQGRDSLLFRYVVTTYSAQPCTIPSLPFLLIGSNQTDTLLSPPKTMAVHSVLPSDTVDLKDLKPQQSAGRPSLLWLWFLLGAGMLGSGVYVLSFLRRCGRTPPPPPPPPPPYEEAMDALDRLESRGYVVKGLAREFVFALSNILKHYVGRRYGIPAAEYTTTELQRWISDSPLQDQQRGQLEWFFVSTDPVKFARMIPDVRTLEKLLTEARQFVERTRPPVDEPADAGQPSPDGREATGGSKENDAAEKS